MRKVLKWGGISLAVLIGLIVLLIIFVPKSNESFQEGREAGRNSNQTQQVQESLSKENKMQVYKKVVAAEDKARSEAEKQCPTNTTEDPLYSKWLEMSDKEQREYLQKCSDLQTQLSEQYRNEVLVQYGLSNDEWSAISNEAITEQWPLE